MLRVVKLPFKGRRQRGTSGARPSHSKFVPPHFMFGSWLLHTSNIVFKKCAPPSDFWLPRMRNPGDGPVSDTRDWNECPDLFNN